MWHRKGLWKLALFGLLGVVLALAVACGKGIPQEDYDAVKQQLTAQEQKATALQQQLSAKTQELAEVKKVTTLIGAKAMPTPTPRPTPTPLPPGVTPPPPARPDAAFLNEVVPFAFYVETLATSSVSKYGYASFPACVPNSIFKRGSKLVWRFEIIDTSTGKRVTDQEGAVVKVRLPHGEDVTARYSKRGGVGPWTWAAGWDIPPDYPLGAFDYQLVVTTKDGRTGTFDQDKVALVRAATATAAGIDSRVQIID